MLNDLLKTGTETISKSVNNKWEQYLGFIKDNSAYESVTVGTAYAYADSYDLYATFAKIGIAERFHYVLLRLNGYKTPSDYTGENRDLKIYDANTLDAIYRKYIDI